MMKITLFALVALAVACAQEQATVEQVPAGQAPAEQAPSPAEQSPAGQAPTEQAPAGQAPAEQAPTGQAPAQQRQAKQVSAKGAAAPVQIVKQVDEVDIDKYSFEFETSDGTSRQETGEYKNDTEQQGLVVKGSYKYVAPDGQHISVTYVADKNGYQPVEETGDKGQAAAQQPESQA